MNFFEMMQQQDQTRIALIHDGKPYTYGQLVAMAGECGERLRAELSGGRWGTEIQRGAESAEPAFRTVHMIRQRTILSQLVEFLGSSACGMLPLLVPQDARVLPVADQIPERACMAVATSGTTGTPKLLFRSYESWADFFPIQNEIFGIHSDSRLFVQGSLAFTGNLNLYMAQFSVGAVVVAQNEFQPRQWGKVMERQKADAVYLIPSKLLCLPRVMKRPNPGIRRIISGSQSLGREEADLLKEYFPNAEIILYYGASELNYITYVTDQEMTEEKNLIGKPFPGVQVTVQEGNIYVDTAYGVEGLELPFSLSDKGYFDEKGNLYFAGRSDDIVGIRGRKVSIYRVENALKNISYITEAAVVVEEHEKKTLLVAYVTGTRSRDQIASVLRQELRRQLSPFEMPAQIHVVPELPRNESGKLDKKRLVRE